MKKLIAEFCISSSLENVNVVKTVDLIQDEVSRWRGFVLGGVVDEGERYACILKTT